MPSLPATQFAVVNGLKLAYLEWPGPAGAPPVLCLPHLTGHKGSFAWLAERLAAAYHVYALDLRGRGESGQPASGYGFAYHASDILALAETLGLGPFTLVGHSFGATAGVYLASIRPQAVRAIVLLDGGADPKVELLQAMYSTIARLDQVYPSLDAYLDAMRAVPYFQPWNAALEQYFRAEVALLEDDSVRTCSSPAAIHRDLDAHFMYCMCLHFPALRCPALFLRPERGLLGDRGHVFSPAEAQAIIGQIPHGRLVEVPGVNHYTMLLHPDSPIVPLVLEFLSQVL